MITNWRWWFFREIQMQCVRATSKGIKNHGKLRNLIIQKPKNYHCTRVMFFSNLIMLRNLLLLLF